MRIILFLTLLVLETAFMKAQQVQEEKFTTVPYEYATYQDATVSLVSGGKSSVKANIYLDGSKLYFLNDTIPMEADMTTIVKVDFDSATYIPVGNAMGRIVIQKDKKALLCVKTIDVYKMKGSSDVSRGQDRSGQNLPFFEIIGYGVTTFIETANSRQDEVVKFPLKNEYHYLLNNTLHPAKAGSILKLYDKQYRKILRTLTEHRFWSWKDEKSLIQLMDLL